MSEFLTQYTFKLVAADPRSNNSGYDAWKRLIMIFESTHFCEFRCELPTLHDLFACFG